MALPIRRLFVDFETGQVYRNFNDLTTAPTYYFNKGDETLLDVVLVRQTGTPEFPMESLPMPIADFGSSLLSIGNTDTLVFSNTPNYEIPAPVLSIGTTVGVNYTFSIDSTPSYGSFTLTFTKTSPALSVTTAPIKFPFTTDDIESAVETAINGAAGWSAASCTVIPTGPFAGNLRAYATNSSTVYELATSSCTLTTTSSLYGFSGLRWSPTDDGSVDTYLDGETEKAALLEIRLVATQTQTIAQHPMMIRDTVA